jgi:putative ABC transport system permease protein
MIDEIALAVRGLARSRLFVLVSTASMAIALGVNVAVLTLCDRLIFKPLPYRDPSSLVQIHLGLSRDPQFRAAILPAEVAQALSQEVDAFQGLAWAHGWVTSEVAPDGGNALAMTPLTPNALTLLGVTPARGRQLTEQDAATSDSMTLLLTWRAWQERFGHDEAVATRSWTARGRTYHVAGVLPPDFILPSSRFLDQFDGVYLVPQRQGPPGLVTIAPFARLKPGVSVTDAQAEVDVVVRRHRWNHPVMAASLASGHERVTVRPLQAGLTILIGPYLWVISVAGWTVLAISSLNLSILILMRHQARRREFAVHAMLGATPGRIARAIVLETMTLVGCAALLAATVCVWTDAALVNLLPPALETFAVSPLDWRILCATLAGICLASGAAAVAPALAAMRADTSALTRAAGRGSDRKGWDGDVLLALQSAFALVVMIGAVVVVPPVVRFITAPIGFNPKNLFVVEIGPPMSSDRTADSDRRARTAASALAQLPHVASAAATMQNPFEQPVDVSEFWTRRGRSGSELDIGDGAFRTMQTDVIAGREFSSDDAGGPGVVAVLNRSGVRALWPDIAMKDTIGRRLDTPDGLRTVVGVVDDVRREPGATATPSLFVPIRRQNDATTVRVLVRMDEDARLDRTLARDHLTRTLSAGSVSVRSIFDEVAARVERPRLLATLFAVLAGTCLLMIAVGVYAVAGVRLDARRREVAIRRTLGATSADVVWRVCRLIGPALTTGIVVGTIGGWLGVSLLVSTVSELSTINASTYVWAALGTIGAAMAGILLPLRRSVTIDPGRTLQEIDQ